MTPRSYRQIGAWIARGAIVAAIAWGLVQLLLWAEPRQPSLRLGTTRGVTQWPE